MYERKYGLLYCPGCMCGQMFIALVCDGVPRNLSGERVRHITDASCRECGYSYGRKDVRDEASGHVLKGMKVIDDATAIAAARAAGLPAGAALDHFVPALTAVRTEVRHAGKNTLPLLPGDRVFEKRFFF